MQEEGEEEGTANLDGRRRRRRWIKGEWGWVGRDLDDVKRRQKNRAIAKHEKRREKSAANCSLGWNWESIEMVCSPNHLVLCWYEVSLKAIDNSKNMWRDNLNDISSGFSDFSSFLFAATSR